MIEAIRARAEELAAAEHEWVGAETYFIGEVHGGDFYNRHPIECRLVGTRRWAPGNTLAAVEEEFDALLEPSRLRPAARSISTCASCAAPTRSIPSTRSPSRCAGVQRRHRGRAAPERRKGRRRRSGLPPGGDPDRLPRPRRNRRPWRRRNVDVAELVRATQVYVALLERLWA